MSGRWRSRHWSSSSEGEEGTTVAAIATGGGRHNRHDEQHHHHRRRQQPPPPPDDDARPHDNGGGGEWKRGQALPPPPPPASGAGCERTPASTSSSSTSSLRGIISSPLALGATGPRSFAVRPAPEIAATATAEKAKAWGSISYASPSADEANEKEKEIDEGGKDWDADDAANVDRRQVSAAAATMRTGRIRTAWAASVPSGGTDPRPPAAAPPASRRGQEAASTTAKSTTTTTTTTTSAKVGDSAAAANVWARAKATSVSGGAPPSDIVAVLAEPSTAVVSDSEFPPFAKTDGDARGGGGPRGSSSSAKNGLPSSSSSSSSSSSFSTTLSSTLPTASSWGRIGSGIDSGSDSGWQQRAADTSEVVRKGVGGNVGKGGADEFPPLSAAATRMANPGTAPRTTAATDARAVTAMVTPAKKKDGGGGSSSSSSSSLNKNKNGKFANHAATTTTSLASFLPPPAAASSSVGTRGPPSSCAPPPPPRGRASATAKTKSSSSSSGNKVVVVGGGASSSATVQAGIKRSAPPPAATGGGPDDSREGGGFAGLDFPTNTTAVGKKGGRFVAATRGGRLQRLGVPRKKKLTSLKKKVLRERLRMWKERNGIIADAGGCEDDDDGEERGGSTRSPEDDRDDNRPSAKRLRTDGASSGDVQSATSSYVGEGTITTSTGTTTNTTLLLKNFIRPEDDDLLDDDEYEEITSDLIHLAGRVGRVVAAFVPRPCPPRDDDVGGDDNEIPSPDDDVGRHVGSAIVRFATDVDARAARDILDGMVVGGRKLRTSILNSIELAESAKNDRDWRLEVLRVLDDGRSSAADEDGDPLTDDPFDAQIDAASEPTAIVFHDILCDDDYEDEEALRESVGDIIGLAKQYGRVIDAMGHTSGNEKGNVCIVYGDHTSADMALRQLNGIVIGGSAVSVSRDDNMNSSQRSGPGEVVLGNALNDDDMEDEDCLNESLSDIRTLAEQHGIVGSVRAEVSSEQRNVRLSYLEGHQAARQAAQRLDGMLLGGVTVSASAVSPTDHMMNDDDKDIEISATVPPPPMYSGDRIIPEQFAACKRVPKIPNAAPRSYASKIGDERAVTLLSEMLGELMRLQERSKDDKNARARRRVVMGLREVARGIRARKIKMVVMANNLDEYGAIDSKLQEILDLARVGELPVLYELNKRKLGKALGKSIKVSVVGIQNADGAHEQFKKLKKMVGFS